MSTNFRNGRRDRLAGLFGDRDPRSLDLSRRRIVFGELLEGECGVAIGYFLIEKLSLVRIERREKKRFGFKRMVCGRRELGI